VARRSVVRLGRARVHRVVAHRGTLVAHGLSASPHHFGDLVVFLLVVIVVTVIVLTLSVAAAHRRSNHLVVVDGQQVQQRRVVHEPDSARRVARRHIDFGGVKRHVHIEHVRLLLDRADQVVSSQVAHRAVIHRRDLTLIFPLQLILQRLSVQNRSRWRRQRGGNLHVPTHFQCPVLQIHARNHRHVAMVRVGASPRTIALSGCLMLSAWRRRKVQIHGGIGMRRRIRRQQSGGIHGRRRSQSVQRLIAQIGIDGAHQHRVHRGLQLQSGGHWRHDARHRQHVAFLLVLGLLIAAVARRSVVRLGRARVHRVVAHRGTLVAHGLSASPHHFGDLVVFLLVVIVVTVIVLTLSVAAAHRRSNHLVVVDGQQVQQRRVVHEPDSARRVARRHIDFGGVKRHVHIEHVRLLLDRADQVVSSQVAHRAVIHRRDLTLIFPLQLILQRLSVQNRSRWRRQRGGNLHVPTHFQCPVLQIHARNHRHVAMVRVGASPRTIALSGCLMLSAWRRRKVQIHGGIGMRRRIRRQQSGGIHGRRRSQSVQRRSHDQLLVGRNGQCHRQHTAGILLERRGNARQRTGQTGEVIAVDVVRVDRVRRLIDRGRRIELRDHRLLHILLLLSFRRRRRRLLLIGRILR